MTEISANKVPKKQRKVEKLGKPWPGPPLSGTSQRDNVHRQINLRDAVKPRPRRTTRPRRTKGEGYEEEEGKNEDEPSEKPPKPERKPSLRNDILVISGLWAIDIIHIAIDNLKDRYFYDIFTIAEEDTIESLTEEKFILIYTLVPMLAVGTSLTYSGGLTILEFLQESKFWVMYVGLIIYSSGTVVGIILAVSRNSAVGIFLAWQELVWYAVHPIRFWFIFHQKFPITVRRSHLFVSGNLLVIGIIEYIVIVLVKNAKKSFVKKFYAVSYGIVTVFTLGWMCGVYFLHRFINSNHGDFDSVRKVYTETEVIENFDRRHTCKSIMLFLALIYPAFVFSIAREYFDLGQIKLLENALAEDVGVSYLRLDLISALLVMIIVEGVLQFLRKTRNEFTDMAFIVVAHLINIITVAAIMHILYLTKDIRYKFPEKDEAILIVNGNIGDKWFLQVGEDINQLHIYNTHVIIKNLPDDGILPIRLVRPETGEIVVEEYREILTSRNLSVNGYNFMKFNDSYRLVQIPSFPNMHYVENKARVLFSNGLEECSNFNKAAYERCKFHPNRTRGGKVGGACVPISINWLQDGNDIDKVIPFKPPANDEILTIEVPCELKMSTESESMRKCRTLPIILNFYQLGPYLGHGDINYSKSWEDIKMYDFLILRLDQSNLFAGLPTFIETKLMKYRPQREKLLVFIMPLFGVSMGLAWVGYIHFLWIQCPVKGRILIIYCFFALTFTSSALTERWLLKFNGNSVFFLMVLTVICFLWHVGASLLFRIRLKRSRKDEMPQQGWRRF